MNTEGTRHLAEALHQLHMPLKKMVYLSSLSIFGPIRKQQPYTEIRESDTPQPNTAYGDSKVKAEKFLDSITPQLPVVTLRPTGVYGPRERDYFMMAKSIKQHVDFAVGYKKQDITFVYVADVVQAVFLALQKGNASIYRKLNCWLDSLGTGQQTLNGLLVISASKLMNMNDTLYSNILITDTGQLTIQGEVEIIGNGNVIVESGGTLILDGGSLLNVRLKLEPGSTLRIINGGAIETQNGFEAPVGAVVSIEEGQII